MDKNNLIKMLAAIVIILEVINLVYVYATDGRVAWFSLFILILVIVVFYYYLNAAQRKDDEGKE